MMRKFDVSLYSFLIIVSFIVMTFSNVFAEGLNHEWSKRFGDPEWDLSYDVTIDRENNVIITGGFYGGIDFGDGYFWSVGVQDIFVAKFNSYGDHIWSKRFGAMYEYNKADSVTIDRENNVIIAGGFFGSVDFGGGPLTSAGSSDIFVAKFDSNGNHIWSQSFGDPEFQHATRVTTDKESNVIIAGNYVGTIDLGGHALTSAGGYDVFVAKFDSNGSHIWSRSFGDPEHQNAKSVTTDKESNVIIAGDFSGTIDLGGGPLISSNGKLDMFLAKFDSNGSHIWSKQFGDHNDYEWGISVATDHGNNVIVTGHCFRTVDFGGGPLAAAGGEDIFVVKFNSNGNHVWSKRFGDSEDHIAKSITIDGENNTIITGYFEGTVDFGGGPLWAIGQEDVFMAKFDSNANHIWSNSFAGGDTKRALGVAVDSENSVIITGYFNETVDFGGGILRSSGSGYDIFLAKFSSSGSPDVTLDLVMPSSYYSSGDLFYLDADTFSISGTPYDCKLFIILSIADQMWFYPSWVAFLPDYQIDFESIIVVNETRSIIPQFSWPYIPEVVTGIQFIGACTNPEISSLVSNADVIEWGFGF